MKKLIVISALVLAGCNNSGGTPAYKILSYEELKNFDTSCTSRTEQQSHLKYILERKGFNADPDQLNDNDRAYNSRLKATLWWYEYRCTNKTQTEPSFVGNLDTAKPMRVKSDLVRSGDCQSRTSITVEGEEEVSANTLTVCGQSKDLESEPKLKIGEQVFETDIQPVPEIKPVYFKHRHSKCRLFRERYMMNSVLQVNHGVICQTDPDMDSWSVVDKW